MSDLYALASLVVGLCALVGLLHWSFSGERDDW